MEFTILKDKKNLDHQNRDYTRDFFTFDFCFPTK